MQTIDEALNKLKKSDFRSRFHLKQKDIDYINEKGMNKIRSHAEDFVRKQTPMRGHPVFIAQHACACCCRGCLNKWYRVARDKQLNEVEQQKIVNLLMAWIEREYNDYNSNEE